MTGSAQGGRSLLVAGLTTDGQLCLVETGGPTGLVGSPTGNGGSMEFSISPIQGIRGYRLEGELDLATVDSLAQRLQEAVDAGGPILLDLSRLRFIDSTGIHAIFQAVTELEKRGWCIYLHTDDGGVLRTLEVVGLGKVNNAHLVDHPRAHTSR